MAVAKWQADGELCTAAAVVAVFCRYRAAVQLYYLLCEVKSNARACYALSRGVASLIEAAEEVVGLFIAKAHSRVGHRQDDVVAGAAYGHGYLACVERVFEGV